MEKKFLIPHVAVIGGSAGSLEIILDIIGKIPVDCPSVLIVVIHRRNDADSVLTELLRAKTALKVKEVEDKDPIKPGYLYIAPADYHLLVESEESFSLDSSEKLHFSRPSIDISFDSVSEIFGDRSIGVLLSGANADGAEGLVRIAENGGITIVQDPATAEVAFMPQQAINLGIVKHIIEGKKIGDFLNILLKT